MAEELPSAFYHYTSVASLFKILCCKALEKETISIKLSNTMQSNDPKEVHFFKDYVFNDTKSGKKMNSLKSKLDFNREPFSFSLIHHYEGNEVKLFGRKGYPHCEIPMWSMYGDKFKGVRLRFDAKELKACVEEKINFILHKCAYKTISEVKELGKDIRTQFRTGEIVDEDLISLYKEACFYKPFSWAYECEWRIASFVNRNDGICIDENNGKNYILTYLPLKCLKAIEIGPLADYGQIQSSLSVLQEKPTQLKNVKIIKSNLQVKY